MAIIEVYVGVTAQLIKVKCRTKDKRDIVARAARKVARSLGGSGGTPLLLRKMTGESDSPVATLRMSKAAVEEMVLVAEDENGTKVTVFVSLARLLARLTRRTMHRSVC